MIQRPGDAGVAFDDPQRQLDVAVRVGVGEPHERLVAGVAHLSVLFFPLVLPLILWGAYAHRSPYAARQARQAFLFHLGILVVDGLIIVALIPLALKGVAYRPIGAGALLRRNLMIYGVGGIIIPFIGIKAIDLAVAALHLA